MSSSPSKDKSKIKKASFARGAAVASVNSKLAFYRTNEYERERLRKNIETR